MQTLTKNNTLDGHKLCITHRIETLIGNNWVQMPDAPLLNSDALAHLISRRLANPKAVYRLIMVPTGSAPEITNRRKIA